MAAIIGFLVGGYVFWKLGRKYQDFQDIMLARRIAKIIEQGEQLNKDKEQFDKWERQDKRMKKIFEEEETA